MSDEEVLERAADVLRRRSSKSKGLWCRVFCGVLESTAADIRRANREGNESTTANTRGGQRG